MSDSQKLQEMQNSNELQSNTEALQQLQEELPSTSMKATEVLENFDKLELEKQLINLRPQQQSLNLNPDIYKDTLLHDASLLLPNPDNSMYDYFADKKARATRIIDTYKGIQESKGNSDSVQALREDFERNVGQYYGGWTSEDADKYMSHKMLQEVYKHIDEFGVPDDNLVKNRRFRENVDPTTFAYLATAYNTKYDNDSSGEWGRHWDAYQYDRANNLAYKQGYKTFEQHQEDAQLINALYRGKDDGVWGEVSEILSGMWAPVWDNKGAAAIGAAAVGVGAVFGGGKGAQLGFGVFSALTSGKDTYDQTIAQIMVGVKKEVPNANDDEIREYARGYGWLAAGLETGSDVVTAKLSKLTDAIGAGGKAVKSKIVKDAVKKGVEKATKLSKAVGSTRPLEAAYRVATRMGVDYAIDYATELGTEGIQDAAVKYAVNDYLGVNPDANWADTTQAFIDSVKQNWSSIGVTTGLMHTPKVAATLYSRVKAQHDFAQNVENRTAEAVAAEAPLKERDPDTSGEVVDDVLNSNVYINPDDVKQAFGKDKELNKFVENKQVKALLDKANKATNGDNVEITSGFYQNLPQEVRDALYDVTVDKNGRPTPQTLRKMLSAEKEQQVRAQIVDEFTQLEKKEQGRQQVQNEVYADLQKTAPKTNANQNNRIAYLTSAFFNSMADLTGIDVVKLYQQYKTQITFNEKNDFTKNPDAINNPDNSGTYRKGLIQLNPRSDFNSVMHEFAHWYLDVMKDLSVGNEKIKQQLDNLVTNFTDGKVTDINNLSAADWNNLQEQFVANYFISLLQGSQSNKVFSGFSKLIGNVKKQHSMFSYYKGNENSTSDKTAHVKNSFEKTYKTKLPTLNKDFTNFVDMMFKAETITEYIKNEYPTDLLLQDIDSAKIDPRIKEALKKHVKAAIEESNNNLSAGVAAYVVKDALIHATQGTGTRKLVSEIENRVKGGTATRRSIIALARKIKEAAKTLYPKIKKEVTASFNQRVNALPNSELAVLKTAERHKINPLGLTDEQKRILNAKGLLSDTGVPIGTILRKHKVPSDTVKRTMAQRGMSLEEATLHLIMEQPTYSQQIENIVLSRVQAEFSEELQTASDNLTTTIAKAHKNLAKVVIETLHTMFGGKKKDVEVTENEVKQIAEIDVNRTSFNRASPNTFFGLARRQEEKARDCLAKGDYQGAVNALRNAYYQNHKAQYASQVKTAIKKTLDKYVKLANRSGKSLKGSYDTEIIELVRHILFNNGISKKRPELSIDEVRQAIADKYGSDVDAITAFNAILEQVENGKTQFYQTQTIEQLNDLIDTVEAVIGISKKGRTMEVDGKKVTYESVKAQILTNLRKHKDVGTKFVKDGKGGTSVIKEKSKFQLVKDAIQSYFHGLQIVEYLAERIDQAHKGIVHSVFYQAISDGVTQYQKKYVEYFNRLQDKMKKIKIENTVIDCPELVLKSGEHWRIGATSRLSATWELIGIILHMASNKDKFINGYLKDIPNVPPERQLAEKEKIFNAWFRRMVAEGHITKEMMDFVAEVWSVSKDIEPEVQRASMHIRGFNFKKVKTLDFSIDFPDGTHKDYKGGYIAALANKDQNDDVHTTDSTDILATLQDMQNNNPCQNPGFLQNRIEGYSRPLEIDPFKLIGQTFDTLKYAYIMPSVVDAKRLLLDKEVRAEFEKRYPNVIHNILDPYLKRCATMSSEKAANGAERFLSAGIRNSSMAIMAGNLINIAQQISNLPTIFTKVKPQYVVKILAAYVMHPINTINAIAHESDYMYVRFKEQYDGVTQVANQFSTDPGQYATTAEQAQVFIQNTVKMTNRYAYAGQHVFQNLIDPIAYLAAKEQALAEGKTKEQAIKFAEETVRQTMASFALQDVANIQTSRPVVKAFTMFVGYFLNMAQLCSTEIYLHAKQSKSGIGSVMYAAYISSLAIVLPSVIAELIKQAGNGEFEWDEDIDWWRSELVWSPVKMGFAAYPIVGTLANKGISTLQGQPSYNRAVISTPIISQFDNATMSMLKTVQDKDVKGRDVRNILNLLSIVTNTPVFSMLGRPVSYGYDYNQGNVVPSDSISVPNEYVEMIRGMLTGIEAKATKNN